MPRFDGQLKNAQLEEIANDNPSPGSRSRVYSDISTPTDPIPRFHDADAWRRMLLGKRRIQYVTANATVSSDADVVACDITNGSIELTMPDPTAAEGSVVTILVLEGEGGGRNVTLAGGFPSMLEDDGSSMTVLAVGGAWRLLHGNLFGAV